ncbi:FAD-dependent oxidoreductase [Pseudomonas fulva]|nr:FAD-dependent oxidoreductase [Pseudomonas fulva]
MDIAIVGAGIAGLSAALALRKQGFNPRVFERRSVPAAGGAGVTLWPNASFVLEQLGVLHAIQAVGGRPLPCAGTMQPAMRWEAWISNCWTEPWATPP